MSLRLNGARLRSSINARGYVCLRCRLNHIQEQRRPISESHKAKLREADEQWRHWATDIRLGKRESMLSTLDSRGFINDVAGDKKKLEQLLTDKRIGVYCGIDPTAPSLHVGHLVPLMALFWMYVHGFHTVSLIGGGTARIGDPTGRTTDRQEMTSTERKANIVSIHYQMKKLWMNLERLAERHGYKWEKYWHRGIANNATWWNSVSFVDVLKYMGRGLRLGPMLSRDTVKRKMASGDGMSFAEFCYPILQAWDWWRLYDEQKIQLQIGGADQYGNIVAGLEAVKHIAKTHPDPDVRKGSTVDDLDAPVGFTVPLLTAASGEKFGKSAGNAVWLDQSMTSLFDLYAFWVGVADADVERYLKLFTLLSHSEIASLMRQHEQDRSTRIPQDTLAHEFIQLVHGLEAADKARKQYFERSEQRKTTNLSALMSSAVDTDTSTGHDWQSAVPRSLSQDELLSKPSGSNPLAYNQDPNIRKRAEFVSQKLNPFAPQDSPNRASGGPARVTLPVSLVKNQPIARVLHSAGLVTSRSEGHRLAQAKGAYFGRRSSNKEQMSDDLSFRPAAPADVGETWRNVIRDHEGGAMDTEGEEGLLILRSGKWKVRVVRIVSDDLFEQLDLPEPPGWREHKSLLAAQRAGTMFDGQPQLEDVSFEEPARYVDRKEAENNRRQQRKEAANFFQNQAVRRRLLSKPLDRPTMNPSERSNARTNPACVAIGTATKPITQPIPLTRSRIGRPRQDNSRMTATRQMRIKAVKQQLLRKAHREGSQKALEVLRAEQRSQREAEDDRISYMRRVQEERQIRAFGIQARATTQLPAPQHAAVPSSAEIAARQDTQRKEEMRSKQMEVIKERRKRERERLVGGMVERGWWRDTDSPGI